MNDKELNQLCSFLIANIMRNVDIFWELSRIEDIDIISIIAGLFDMLYFEIKGEHYDYMWHWCNKIGGWCDTEYLYKECDIKYLTNKDSEKNG